VAETTGGQYFRATDEERLAEIYEEINGLERSEISVKQFREYRELFGWLLIPAVALVMGTAFVSQNIFRKRV
jgi:Ca-activated chloride channel family protein